MGDNGKTATLPVKGATIHYKLRGEGPLLLIFQGGDNDAEGTDAMSDHLVDSYTVLTYDRRGLSRSSIDDIDASVDLTVHADDASHLLRAVTDQPALVLGMSIGGLIGLELISRNPKQVRLLVTHEPPAMEALPEAERLNAVRAQENVEELLREEGLMGAMEKFLEITGIDFDDHEEDVVIPEPKPERMANLEFMLAHDAPAVRTHHLDLQALRDASDRIVLAVGATSAEFPRNCAEALGEELQKPLAVFPGNHASFMLRPKGFAARLREVLTEHV